MPGLSAGLSGILPLMPGLLRSCPERQINKNLAREAPGAPPEASGAQFPSILAPEQRELHHIPVLSPPSAAILVFPRGVSSLVNPGVSTTLFVQSGTQPGRCFCVRPSSSRVLFLLVLLVGGRIA